jgi:peroxiredoxin Q/BCP
LNDKSESTSLQQFRGKYVVLFIYYKDGTFGCAAEQKSFRDLKDKFDKHDAVILGVSRDDTTSHQTAVEENNLNYALLTDTDGKISEAYGALDENNRLIRSTYIISPEGKVAASWPKVFGFERHAQEVLNKLEEIVNGGTENKDDTKRDGENEENENEENDEDEDNEDNENEENEDNEEDNEDDANEQDDDDDDA